MRHISLMSFINILNSWRPSVRMSELTGEKNRPCTRRGSERVGHVVVEFVDVKEEDSMG